MKPKWDKETTAEVGQGGSQRMEADKVGQATLHVGQAEDKSQELCVKPNRQLNVGQSQAEVGQATLQVGR